ncbi:diguanylate cyclase (plasmid) [Pseudoalteromonas lipolytica]|uniref:diguanylate cyclase n=1 Tax=Pseudoalteromonas lipolytica TaxID=570156 RepID=A0AAD0SA66_9GAMM|nr:MULTISPECIES: tetratricopeptide repeat-containing diguanylate cyclase [Pseudoalteromonas]AXV67391.1 diguanylate cyclase [Pseudoalteromonas donghaensis]QLJ10206.1 GGDEF domain-containing protein [Pseudoalteromonas sp. JSTW]
MLRVLCFVLFSSSLAANEVKNEIDKVLYGYTSLSESRAILEKLEQGMPYKNGLDDARVMAFKCWFSDVTTSIGLLHYNAFLNNAKPIIHSSSSETLKQDLTACEAFQEYNQGNYQFAATLLTPITQNSANTQNPEELNAIATANTVLNRIYLALGNYEDAFHAAQKAYQLFEKSGNSYEQALALKEIADIHIALYNFDLAIEQLQRSATELAKFNKQEHYKVIDQLAFAHEKSGNFPKAIELYQSIKKDVRSYESDNGYAYVLIKLAELYTELDQLNAAKSYLTAVDKLKINDSWIKTLLTMTQAQWNLKSNNLNAALTLFNMLQTEQNSWPVSFKERYLNFASLVAEATNDSSLHINAQQQLITIVKQKQKDIANNALISARLNFNFEQQKREITRLEQASALQKELLTVAEDKAFWQRLTLIIASVCLFLFAIYTFKQVRQKKYYEILALKDELTGIANRRAIINLKRKVMQKNQHNSQVSSLISIDIDHFKAVNDQYGHDIGDELIISVVNTIVSTVRCSDMVGRVGGEEFLIVLENQTLNNAKEIAWRIRHSIAEKQHTSLRVNATVSIGVIEISQQETAEQAAKRVDLNLYKAKENGRNRVVV